MGTRTQGHHPTRPALVPGSPRRDAGQHECSAPTGPPAPGCTRSGAGCRCVGAPGWIPRAPAPSRSGSHQEHCRGTCTGGQSGAGGAGDGAWGLQGSHLSRISSGKRVLSSSSVRVGRVTKYTAPPSVPRQTMAPAAIGSTTVTRVMPGEQLGGNRGCLNTVLGLGEHQRDPDLPCSTPSLPSP